jgi:hypothetical protein
VSLDYPSTLPNPTRVLHSPKRRVSESDLLGPASYSRREADYAGTMDVEFFLNDTQAALFYSWWKDDLVYGGCWFNCSWPAMRPGSLVCQFKTEPVLAHVYNGAYRVSATVQVRGVSEAVTSESLVGLTTYFAENVSPGGYANGAPLAQYNSFQALLSSVVIEPFTSHTNAATPVLTVFGGLGSLDYVPATLGSGRIQTTVAAGRFNTTGATSGPAAGNWWQSSRSFTVGFSAAIRAFGTYIVDGADFDGTLTVTLQPVSGPSIPFVLPLTTTAVNGGLVFWGFTDDSMTYAAVTFNITQTAPFVGQYDILGFDDMIIGTYPA